ncbi:MAG TPA: hypothetical protein DIC32_07835 [Acinetobacter radioresistens]|uniref:Uncharacterized protein n=1 Tax=Acinetobacter radioresistens TaxID=40216 RepID=A0A3D3G170_ACIRA|nr:hypothetical protein [Acinetobacter radioresistens]
MTREVRVEFYKGVTRSDVTAFLNEIDKLNGKVSKFSTIHKGKLILTFRAFEGISNKEFLKLMECVLAILKLVACVDKVININ